MSIFDRIPHAPGFGAWGWGSDVAELLWNSLDADAKELSVEFAHNDLAPGTSKIIVYDNGDGFSRSERCRWRSPIIRSHATWPNAS